MSFLFSRRPAPTNNRQEFDQVAQAIQQAYNQAHRQPQTTLAEIKGLGRQLRASRSLDSLQRQLLNAYILDAAGCARIELGQTRQGLATLEKAVKVYQKLPDKTPLVNNLLNQARAWLMKNDLTRGLAQLERSLAAAKEGRLDRTEAEILYKLGVLYNLRNQPDKATEAFGRGLLLCQQTGQRALVANFLTQFGQIYMQNDELEKAYDYFERSRDIYEQEGDQENMLISLGQLGQLARRRGELDTALELGRQGLELARQQANREEEEVFLQDLARVYLARQEYPQAEEYSRQSLALAEQNAEREAMLRAYELLVQIALGREDYATARQWIDAGYTTAQQSNHRRDLAVFLNDRAELFLTERDWAGATRCFEELAALFKELKDYPLLTTLYMRLGNAYLDELNQPAKAVEMADRCFELAVAQRGQPAMFAFTSAMRLIQMLAERHYYAEGLLLATRCLERANEILSASRKKKLAATERDQQNRWMLFAQVLIILTATLQDLKSGQPSLQPKVMEFIGQLKTRFGDSFTLEGWTTTMYERLKG